MNAAACRVAVGVASLTVVVACSSYTSGRYVASEPLPTTEVVVRSELSIRQTEGPSIASPSLRLALFSRDSVTYQAVRQFEVIRSPAPKRNIAGVVVGGGVALVAALNGDTVTKKGLFLNGVAVASALTSLGFFLKVLDSTREVVPNRYNRDTVRSIGRMREGRPTSASTLTVTIDGRTRSYTTTGMADAKIDLVKDFGLDRFAAPSTVVVTASVLDPARTTSYTTRLVSTQWTELCARAKGNGPIWANPSARSGEVGQFKAGNVYAVADSAAYWLRVVIDSRGTMGWMPRDATEEFWLARVQSRCGG